MRLFSVLAGLLVAPVAVGELIQVQVVMRAGARKFIPVGEPRLEIGAPLLPEGYTSMEALGKLIRNRYLVPGADVPLANVTGMYKPGDALIRSISRDQAASSANALVFGLYPPVTTPFADSKTKLLSNGHQDVPVFTLSRGVDNLLSAYAVCPKLEEDIAAYVNSTEFRAKAEETIGVRQFLAANYNMSSELVYMPFIYDRALVGRKYHDEAARGKFPLNETIFGKLKAMADFVEVGKFRNNVAGNLCGGPLLGQIFERVTLAMYGDKTRSNPLLGYVGTHPTMACLIGAMNLTDPILTTEMTPYASALVFELHRIGSQHYLQLLYHEGGNSTSFRTVPLGKKGGPCEDDSTLCAVDDARMLFRQAMQPSLIDWCDSCQAYFMPACNQAAQIKLAEIITSDQEVTKKAKRRGTINTVGAAFIGVLCGALFALLLRDGVPAIRRKVVARRGRNYSPAHEDGIETPERGGDAI